MMLSCGLTELRQLDENVVEIVDGEHRGNVPVESLQD